MWKPRPEDGADADRQHERADLSGHSHRERDALRKVDSEAGGVAPQEAGWSFKSEPLSNRNSSRNPGEEIQRSQGKYEERFAHVDVLRQAAPLW